MVQSWGILDHLGWNWPSWSIGAECLAYVAFALAAWGGWLRRRWVVPVSAALGLMAYGLIAWRWGTLDRTYDLGLVRCLAGFPLGAGVYQLCAGRRVQAKEGAVLIDGGLVGVIAFASQPGVVLTDPVFAAWVALLHSEARQGAKLLSTA